ncbi:hypothetical protein BDU57DRAFT_543647 [Ampelomyces quisqualis]|uniref:Uncharacterized protein n=1 Tax=Ampelomyces quisqualis TaxID=50730 RepID=A0A6A5Q7Y3_AMPQU|nr:hypothetical protein BDU57DRAFT_543647 [Ampelomyces quisqualis]
MDNSAALSYIDNIRATLAADMDRLGSLYQDKIRQLPALKVTRSVQDPQQSEPHETSARHLSAASCLPNVDESMAALLPSLERGQNMWCSFGNTKTTALQMYFVQLAPQHDRLILGPPVPPASTQQLRVKTVSLRGVQPLVVSRHTADPSPTAKLASQCLRLSTLYNQADLYLIAEKRTVADWQRCLSYIHAKLRGY